ncbi:Rrt6p ASCRUDRAFT_37076 [Ascoidea rubescens DSM 1968]|uniref:GOLD domain-containing protein n=1 Tax=Ascoidea rubescens DSM 1968 TaxID=1344418 RepID=A0A1D2VD71_9ASCO|nr:hypothetical protein ASCRUDRAFT_37076 [Ascoidea rubescens DSM 1968]ODV59581.1 hypothetical protein ASCRUDRAFT_37076 [Ascoidea rubescens DSM 1968]
MFVGDKINSQSLNFKVFDQFGNLYRSKSDISGKLRIIFKTSFLNNYNNNNSNSNKIMNDYDISQRYFEICFENYLKDASWSNDGENKEIVMDLEIGLKSRDLNLIKQSEKLTPLHKDLIQIENEIDDLTDNLYYLVKREANLRDTNENTYINVVKSQIVIIILLIFISLLQLLYFYNYLKTRKVIQ